MYSRFCFGVKQKFFVVLSWNQTQILEVVEFSSFTVIDVTDKFGLSYFIVY